MFFNYYVIHKKCAILLREMEIRMDKKTTIEEMKNMVKKFCEDRSWDMFHSPKELAIGMSTEANELL